MEEFDYNKLGLKCGLEIHQQLDAGGKKLFCNCSSILRSEEPDFIITRKLHAVAGESGEVDEAAKHEVSQDREFFYQGYDTVCLVETDEEPPHKINNEALKTVLQVAILLNAKIFPLTQIMRKTVIDGSNTSGFQRTVLIARDGYVDTTHGRVRIDSICLEEDSARIVKVEVDKKIFRLDRLGIPLIEIATAPDITSPKQAKEVALHLGEILRSCKVLRGIGTIRQDVNVSIKKGARVEIKGFQNPAMMVKTIDGEIKRQLELIDEEKEVSEEVRNALPDGKTKFLRPMPGSARMYPETDLPLLKISRNLINDVKKDLPKLRKDVKKDLEKSGLNEDMIKLLFKQNKLDEFNELIVILNNPMLIAKILLIYPKEFAKRHKMNLEEVEKILEENYISVLKKVKIGKISESHLKYTLEKVVKGEELKDTENKKEIENVDEKIMNLIKDKPGLSENAYMGLVMKDSAIRGNVDGKTVREIIGRLVK